MPRTLTFIFVLLLVVFCVLPTQADSLTMRLLNKPVPSGVTVADLGKEGPPPRIFYQGRSVLVVCEEGRRWIAVVGISLNIRPGPQRLEVWATAGNHEECFSVGSKYYREQHITLKNRCQVNPPPEDLKRIEREFAEQTAAYHRFSPDPPSNLVFDKLVDGPLSSPSGLRRFFNDEERNPHSGLDLTVPAGIPIKVLAAGKMILIGDYFSNGETVLVNYGQDFISVFRHLLEIDIKLGQQVSRSGVLGKVGATGRAAGPHMHQNVSLNGARVDPATFIGTFQP